jgi:hypothetical protein
MRARFELLLWGSALIGVVGASMAASAATPETMPPRADAGAIENGIVVPAESLGERVLRAVAHDPFRMTRTPSPVPFGAAGPAVASAPTAIIVPPLLLRGIVGPPWRAVLEGAPGIELGQLVRTGDSIGGARVIAVGSDAVTLRTPDTTWTLTMRRP